MPRKCRGPVAAGYQHLPGLWPPEPQAAEAAVSGPGTSAAAPGRYSARPPERPERTIVNLLLIVGGFYSEVALRNEKQRAQCILDTS